jgi:hypothetical protein
MGTKLNFGEFIGDLQPITVDTIPANQPISESGKIVATEVQIEPVTVTQ